MFKDQSASSFRVTDRPPSTNEMVNLEIEGLVGAINAFIKTGFSTLVDGIPEHLYELLASFSKHVPINDPRYQSVQKLIKESLYEANLQYQARLKLLSREQGEAHQEQLMDLLELIDTPRDAERVVNRMRENDSDDYDRRVWQKATRFQNLAQDTPLVGVKPRASLSTLVKVERLLDGQDETFSPDESPTDDALMGIADPAASTIRPLAKPISQPPHISERLTRR